MKDTYGPGNNQPHLRKRDDFERIKDEFDQLTRDIAADLVLFGEATPDEALRRAPILAVSQMKKRAMLAQNMIDRALAKKP